MARRSIKKRNARLRKKRVFSEIDALHTDLHMHSNISDGRLSPQGVLESAVCGGLQVISLTDHDVYPQLKWGIHHISTSVVDKEQIQNTKTKKIFVIHGTEISVSYEETEQHVLVYFPREAPEEFKGYCKKLCKSRAKRHDEIIDILRSKGCNNLEYSGLEAREGSRALTRLHVAQQLIERGYVKNISEAFELWLSHLELPNAFPKIEDVLRDMKEMGGLTSWAHPKIGDAKKWLAYFHSCGLQGIEIHRGGNKKRYAKKQLLSMARSYNMHITGGSDSHGHHPLGRFFIGLANYESWMQPLGLWGVIEDTMKDVSISEK